jgi:hypothetical protein
MNFPKQVLDGCTRILRHFVHKCISHQAEPDLLRSQARLGGGHLCYRILYRFFSLSYFPAAREVFQLRATCPEKYFYTKSTSTRFTFELDLVWGHLFDDIL